MNKRTGKSGATTSGYLLYPLPPGEDYYHPLPIYLLSGGEAPNKSHQRVSLSEIVTCSSREEQYLVV